MVGVSRASASEVSSVSTTKLVRNGQISWLGGGGVSAMEPLLVESLVESLRQGRTIIGDLFLSSLQSPRGHRGGVKGCPPPL